MKKFTISLLSLLILVGNISAQIPSGYYNDAQDLSGTALRQALHNIIDGHNSQTYASLWTHFRETDRKSNNKVWDMYSDVPNGVPPYEFAFVSDQCGSYQQEGDCYNREHSWPKSWFNDNAPMDTDLFHLVPTDGYVNGKRGNYAYGETKTIFWESENGSKVGASGFSNMTGTVFEPIDAYKGDFARIYFYMATRYFNEDAGWYSNSLIDGADFTNVGVALLLKWHKQDPVSQKEIDRNNAIYLIQNNRNPFVDHPEYAKAIWGDIDVPPYFVNFIGNQTLKEGEELNLEIAIVDDKPSEVDISYTCIFCSADFATITQNTDTLYNLRLAPQSGDAGTYEIAINASDAVNTNVNYSITVLIEEGNGITNPEEFFIVTPSVTNNNFNISSTNYNIEETIFNVYSITGQMIDKFILSGTINHKFGLAYPRGTYILKAENKQLAYTQKLIKQ